MSGLQLAATSSFTPPARAASSAWSACRHPTGRVDSWESVGWPPAERSSRGAELPFPNQPARRFASEMADVQIVFRVVRLLLCRAPRFDLDPLQIRVARRLNGKPLD